MVDLTPGRFLREFYRQGSAEMQRREFRDVPVVALPVDWAEGMDKGSPDQIRGLSKLFITAAGNACHGGVCDGRLWFPDHPWWSDHPGRWENVFAAFATGKFIIARYAWKVNGVVVPRGSDTDLCGHAMEYCYSLLFNENMPVRFQGWHSSVATARLGAMAFYLFQLWDTPEEVVETLNVCAEDVGAPGPDEEFGRGIVSVVCDRVQMREVQMAVESLGSYNLSPVMGEMLTGLESSVFAFYPPTSASIPTSLPLDSTPFFSLNGLSKETMVGHLGTRMSLKGTDLFLAGGTDYTPLGLRSSLIPTTRTPFMEVGTRRNVLRRGRNTLSLLSTYGVQRGRVPHRPRGQPGDTVRPGPSGTRLSRSIPTTVVSSAPWAYRDTRRPARRGRPSSRDTRSSASFSPFGRYQVFPKPPGIAASAKGSFRAPAQPARIAGRRLSGSPRSPWTK